MNIENLTIGEVKHLVSMFNGMVFQPNQNDQHPFVGKFVICRCYSAGVHAGILVSQTGNQAILKDSRRLWQWTANDGIALSGLAVHGLKSGKLDTLLPEIALTGVIETIPCTNNTRESIYACG